MGEPTNYLTLTDAVIRNTTMPTGKAQHYLHDDKLPGLALRMRATGGRTWVYLFTKPGVKGTQRGAAKDLRKHTHTLLEWCVGEGYVEHNVLAGYRAPKETPARE